MDRRKISFDLIARGFQEIDKPQSYSQTVAKKNFNLLIAVSANNCFKLVLVEICANFMQAEVLEREVFVLPPDDLRKQGKVWRLKKLLYGLDFASRLFLLNIKGTLVGLGLKIMS